MKLFRKHGGQRRWGLQIGRFLIGVTEIPEEKPTEPQAQGKGAEEVSGEAYQVIGAIADAGGLFEHPATQAALDYFGHDEWAEGKEILPFSITPASN